MDGMGSCPLASFTFAAAPLQSSNRKEMKCQRFFLNTPVLITEF